MLRVKHRYHAFHIAAASVIRTPKSALYLTIEQEMPLIERLAGPCGSPPWVTRSPPTFAVFALFGNRDWPPVLSELAAALTDPPETLLTYRNV